jgi:phage gpG-like protein
MPVSLRSPSGLGLSEQVARIKENVKPTADDVRYVAERFKARIITRTLRGVDADQQQFKPYSDAYAKRKAKSGRNSSQVDLTWSGRMLQGLMMHSITDRYFTIGVYGEEAARAAAHNAGKGKMPRRKFIALGKDDRRLMEEDLKERIRARLARLG